jgi:UDP-glucose 4-epimerase
MTILITGASGFLGKKLIKKVNTGDEKIIATYNSNIDPSIFKAANVSWVNVDLSKQNLDLSFLPKIDKVINLAGLTLGSTKNDLSYFYSNELITFNLLNKLSSTCQDFIHASSQVVYGDADNLNVTEKFPIDVKESSYACSKVNSENWLKWFQRKTNGRYISLRLCGFIDGGGLVDYIIDNALKNNEIELFSNGEISRDYLPAEDAIRAILNSMKYIDNLSNNFYPINIGSGQPISSIDIAKLIKETLKSESKIITSSKKGPQGNFVFDITTAKELIKFFPSNLHTEINKYALLRKASNEK